MKTLNQILEDMDINCADDFYDKMAENWDDGNDAIFVYNTETEKARFGRMPKDNWYYVKGDILLARMHKPTELNYENEDLFDDYERHQISRYYKGDWYEWLKKHNSYPLENRINDAGRIYFETNWSQFYNEMEDKLMEAQKEVSKTTKKLVRSHINKLYNMVEQGEKEKFLKNLSLSDMVYNILDKENIYIAIDYIKILYNAIEKWLKEA
mgnify:CR=1 FL=1